MYPAQTFDNNFVAEYRRDSCPLVLGYPVTGGLESLRLSSDVRERLIVKCSIIINMQLQINSVNDT